MLGMMLLTKSLGELSVTDRLLTLTAKHGTATIQGKKYHGNELLTPLSQKKSLKKASINLMPDTQMKLSFPYQK